jgi:DNA-binding transcriptional LysR family regulator
LQFLQQLTMQFTANDPLKNLAFNDLKIFLRIAALRNLSSVARENSLPTSKISRTLAHLEKMCGARLIHRSTHGLTLTADGEVFLNYCIQIAETLDELEGEFASHTNDVSGMVRVTASTVIAEHFLLPSLHALRKKYPKLHINLLASDQKLDMTREGIDIAIRTGHALPDTVIARKLGQLGRGLYASPTYIAQFGMPKHPHELDRHQLVTNSAATHLNQWTFTINGVQSKYLAQGQLRSNDTSMTTHMVLQDLGIGRLATMVGEPMVDAKHLVPVLAEFLSDKSIPIYAVIASARQRLPKIKACIDFWSTQATTNPYLQANTLENDLNYLS